MASLREQVLARIAAVLTAGTSATVYRSREVHITRVETPAINVLFVNEQDVRVGDQTDRHELEVSLAIFVRGDPFDQIADTVAEPAHRALMADAALRAIALDIRKTTTEVESQEADRTAGTLTMKYRITYLSKATDIAAQP